MSADTPIFKLPDDPAEIVAHVLAHHSGRACITNSFQCEDMVVLDLLRRRVPEIPVVFLETGYHFKETYAFRDKMTEEWKLNLINAQSELSVSEQEASFGILHRSDPGRCCQLRKVEPLMRALENFDVWFTGLRREQSPSRKNLKVIEHHVLPSGKTILKVSPLAAWEWKQLWRYTAEHQIPYLPLYDRGYLSIGCEPCTSVPLESDNPRSGRWGGTKLECGIHTFSKTVEPQ